MDPLTLPARPDRAELVSNDVQDVGGTDLLGLRSVSEDVGRSLLDAATTQTPNIRYLSLRAWIIYRYAELGGRDTWSEFSEFAALVESALAFGSTLTDDRTSSVIGARQARNEREAERFGLRRLTKQLAVSIYGGRDGPFHALGFGARETGEVPALLEGSGDVLARAVGSALDAAPVLSAVRPRAPTEATRGDLAELWRTFPLNLPAGDERRLLLGALFPTLPTPSQRNRIATLTLLLELARTCKKPPAEQDVFETVVSPNLSHLPEPLRAIADGWTRFLVRYAIAAAHEAAVASVTSALGSAPGRRLPWSRCCSDIVERGLGDGLRAVGLSGISGRTPVRDFVHAIEEITPESSVSAGIRRWTGELHELRVAWHPALGVAQGVALLPVLWALVVRRVEAGVDSKAEPFKLLSRHGWARLGVAEVILPAVRGWRSSARPLEELTQDLLRRSVDQHVRVAWSRFASEPWKDVSVLSTDGDEWIHKKALRWGHAASRLSIAIGWLQQLGLIGPHGLTPDGVTAREKGLETLTQGTVA